VQLNTDEMLAAQIKEGITAFQLAAEGNYVKTLQVM
jgi:hypothetical protein